MAQNSIGYEGRIVSWDSENRKPAPLKFTRSANGVAVLSLVLSEQHQMKKAQALKDPELKKIVEAEVRNKSKGADDWVNTTTSWHRLTVFGDKAEEYAQDADFNHGALVTVSDATYTEEAPWETKDQVKRAGRPETIGDRKGSLEIKFAPRDNDMPPAWDGESEVAKTGGGGGGRPAKEQAPAEDEGF